jgi:multiple sugar transport system permease protein
MPESKTLLRRNFLVRLHSVLWERGYAFILPVTVLLIMTILVPLVEGLAYSMRVMQGSIEQIGFGNFKVLFKSDFTKAFCTTVLFTAGAVSLHFTIGFIAALLINELGKSHVRTTVRLLLTLPWAVVTVVVGMTWRWMFNTLYGVINDFLFRLHLIQDPVQWLSSPLLALPAVIIADAWRGYPFMMVVLLAGLQSIPADQYEAGRVDGASGIQLFRYITLPNLRKVALVAVLLDSIWTFKHFDLIKVMTGGGPGNATEVLATMVYRYAFEFFRYGEASAIAVVMLVILMVMAIPYIKAIQSDRESL